MIYGHSLKSTLVAIVVPDELATASWAESKGIKGSYEELCARDDLKDEIMKQVRKCFNDCNYVVFILKFRITKLCYAMFNVSLLR